MGRDLRKFLLIDTVVLRHRILKILLPVQGDAGHLVLIEEQEAAYPVDHGFARGARAIRENALEARGDSVRHGNVSDTALRLRTLNVIAHVAGSLELLVHPYAALFEVEIIHREAAELGNAEPRVQEDEEGVVITLVVLVARHELEEPALLLGGKGLACDHVVHQHGGKLEVEGVSADEVVLLRHLKRGLQDPAYCVNGAVVLPMDVLEVEKARKPLLYMCVLIFCSSSRRDSRKFSRFIEVNPNTSFERRTNRTQQTLARAAARTCSAGCYG